MMLLVGPFERLHALMGFENALIAMMEEPEEVAAFFDALMVHKCRLIDKLCDHYRPDVINFHDDWGTQLAMFFRPELWRRLVKPQLERAVDACHRKGLFFEMHSCGKIEAVVPELVDIGADSFQGMSLNNVSALKAQTGKKLSYLTCARGGCYAPWFREAQTWWYPIVADEVEKCRRILQSERSPAVPRGHIRRAAARQLETSTFQVHNCIRRTL